VHGSAYPRRGIDHSSQYRDERADPASIRFSNSPHSGYPDARPQKDGLAAPGLAALHVGPPRTREAEFASEEITPLGSNQFDRQGPLVRSLIEVGNQGRERLRVLACKLSTLGHPKRGMMPSERPSKGEAWKVCAGLTPLGQIRVLLRKE
jgi:hypothetical protein